MSKKNFIALANAIISHNAREGAREEFTQMQLQTLANFCANQNPNFMRDRWTDYIAGKCGPNGGTIKTPKA